MNFNKAPYVPGRPRRPRRAAKGSPRGLQRDPKDVQREPKGFQTSQKEPKVGPGGAKGARKTPKGSQRKPKGKDIYQKTPDQPPKRTLCYKSIQIHASSYRFNQSQYSLIHINANQYKSLCPYRSINNNRTNIHQYHKFI